MLLIIAIAVVVVSTALILVSYARWNYGTLESMGVPVLKPTLLFGSIPRLHTQVIHDEDIRRFKEFGPVFGVYEGRNPILYICDPDTIKKFTVTEFHSFEDRRRINFGNRYFNEMQDFLPYDKWKVIKSHFMPVFSPSSIKAMLPGMEVCMREFVERLNRLNCLSERRSVINVRREMAGYMLAAAGMNMFGLKISDPQADDNLFRVACERTIEQDIEYGALYSLSLSFPWLTKWAPTHGSLAVQKLREMVDMAVATARKNRSIAPGSDLLNRMIYLLDSLQTSEYKKLGISETTVYGQAMTLFIVNYEGLTSLMTLLIHFLATNPEAQRKVQEEVDADFETTNNSPDDEAPSQLPYLTACIHETLRLAPIPRRVERMCVKDCEINGIKIKKGVNVMVPLYAAHRNPDYFDEPDAFRPERFFPENKKGIEPYAASFFGHGPRNCGGQRYTMEVVRFSAARLLHKFEFRTCAQTKLKFKRGRMFIVQFEPLYLEILSRRHKFTQE